MLSGDVEQVRELVQRDAGTMNALCKGGFHAAQLAVQFCEADALSVLLQHGADVTKTTARGNTLLHLSATVEDHAPCAVLLASGRFEGSELEAKNSFMFTPLAAAVDAGATEQVRHTSLVCLCLMMCVSDTLANDTGAPSAGGGV